MILNDHEAGQGKRFSKIALLRAELVDCIASDAGLGVRLHHPCLSQRSAPFAATFM